MATDIETQNTDLGRQETFDEKVPVVDLEWASLRRVPDKLPKIALLILAVEVHISILLQGPPITLYKARRAIHILWSQWPHTELHQVSFEPQCQTLLKHY
jgi:hypothetical protein